MQPEFKAYVRRLVERAVETRALARAACEHSRQFHALHQARAGLRFSRKLRQILHGEKRVA